MTLIYLGVNYIYRSYLKTKLSKGGPKGALRKERKLLSKNKLVTLCNSSVFPYLNYCLEVWGGAQDTHIKSLIILHKRAILIDHLLVSDDTHKANISLIKTINTERVIFVQGWIVNVYDSSQNACGPTRVNIQIKGHLVSFGYSE